MSERRTEQCFRSERPHQRWGARFSRLSRKLRQQGLELLSTRPIHCLGQLYGLKVTLRSTDGYKGVRIVPWPVNVQKVMSMWNNRCDGVYLGWKRGIEQAALIRSIKRTDCNIQLTCDKDISDTFIKMEPGPKKMQHAVKVIPYYALDSTYDPRKSTTGGSKPWKQRFNQWLSTEKLESMRHSDSYLVFFKYTVPFMPQAFDILSQQLSYNEMAYRIGLLKKPPNVISHTLLMYGHILAIAGDWHAGVAAPVPIRANGYRTMGKNVPRGFYPPQFVPLWDKPTRVLPKGVLTPAKMPPKAPFKVATATKGLNYVGWNNDRVVQELREYALNFGEVQPSQVYHPGLHTYCDGAMWRYRMRAQL